MNERVVKRTPHFNNYNVTVFVLLLDYNSINLLGNQCSGWFFVYLYVLVVLM